MFVFQNKLVPQKSPELKQLTFYRSYPIQLEELAQQQQLDKRLLFQRLQAL
jgi:hypothetical protein